MKTHTISHDGTTFTTITARGASLAAYGEHAFGGKLWVRTYEDGALVSEQKFPRPKSVVVDNAPHIGETAPKPRKVYRDNFAAGWKRYGAGFASIHGAYRKYASMV